MCDMPSFPIGLNTYPWSLYPFKKHITKKLFAVKIQLCVCGGEQRTTNTFF